MRWLKATPLLVTLIFSQPAAAEPFASEPSAGRLSSARLLAGSEEPDGVRLAALEIDLAPKAVTYWRTPGEAGVAPTLDFSGFGKSCERRDAFSGAKAHKGGRRRRGRL